MGSRRAVSLDLISKAIAAVDDPEYPGLSIVDLGLVENYEVDDSGAVTVDLVPTFTGCPALAMIAKDVRDAVTEVDGISTVAVNWLLSPTWTTDRISERGKAVLADQFTVAVQIGTTDSGCPRCGGKLDEESMFGPSRCRSVSHCSTCAETVEVMRA